MVAFRLYNVFAVALLVTVLLGTGGAYGYVIDGQLNDWGGSPFRMPGSIRPFGRPPAGGLVTNDNPRILSRTREQLDRPAPLGGVGVR